LTILAGSQSRRRVVIGCGSSIDLFFVMHGFSTRKPDLSHHSRSMAPRSAGCTLVLQRRANLFPTNDVSVVYSIACGSEMATHCGFGGGGGRALDGDAVEFKRRLKSCGVLGRRLAGSSTTCCRFHIASISAGTLRLWP
jgi:hypothetical protein